MRKLSIIAGYAALALVVLAPLTLGAVDAWAWATLAIGMGAIGFICAIGLMSQRTPILLWPLIIPTILCLCAAIWAWLQTSTAWLDWVHPISLAAQNILPNVHPAISLNPDATRQTLLRWAMYAVTFFVAYVWGQDAGRARRGLNALVIAGTIYAVYGMIVLFAGSDMALWVHKPMYQQDVTGPFINKNNFASYLGALLCIAIGLLLRRVVRDTAGVQGSEFWRRFMACCTGRGAWLVIAVVVMFSALLLAHSRGGLLSFAVAFCVLVALMRAARIFRGKIFYWGVGAMTIALVFLFFLSGDGVFDRLVSDGEPARPQLYELVTTAIADRPILGHGLGSFPEVFQIYRTEDMPATFFTERAHSVYLENMLELGIPAALALFIGIGTLMWHAAASVRLPERHRTIPAVCAAAMIMLCVHSLIDFPLQIPAITMLFMFLLGLGTAQAKNQIRL
jgi:O-antigen ligase